jgi:hypothetical protein
MDAVTSFELEAQRRRETVAGDRGNAAWQRTNAISDSVERAERQPARLIGLPGRLTEGMRASADCQPSPVTR